MNTKLVSSFISFFILLSFSSFTNATVTVTVENSIGFPSSQRNNVDVSFANPYDTIRSFQLDICDADNYLTCTACEPIGRGKGEGVRCSVSEQSDGCCRILFYDPILPFHVIEPGNGPVVSVSYAISEEMPKGECRDLNLSNISLSDELNNRLDSIPVSGQMCVQDIPYNAVPTLSEWGVIIFMTIVLGSGIFIILIRKIA